MASIGGVLSASQPTIPIFDGKAYEHWSIKMKTLFLSQDLWDLIENGYVDPYADGEEVRLTAAQKTELKENRKKDAKALFFIQQALHESIFARIAIAATSKEAWTILKNEFQGSAKVLAQRHISMADWADLPRDMLNLIFDRLNILDSIHFGAVCTSWHAVSKQRAYPGTAPWIVVLDDTDEERKSPAFFSIYERRTHRLDIPELLRGRRFWGCANGWLVTQDINLEMHLVQPFLGIRMQIPSPPPYEEGDVYSPEELLKLTIQKVFLSSDPVSCPEDCTIVAIHGFRRKLGKLACLKLGDEKWTLVDDPIGRYWDVTYYKGQLLGVTSLNEIVACELISPVPRVRRFARRVQGSIAGRKHLVELKGDLLCVARSICYYPTPELDYVHDDDDVDDEWEKAVYVDRVVTTGFEVLKLDVGSGRWVEVGSLGDEALFVGQGTSISFPARNLPGCMQNCIYFTDDDVPSRPEHHGYYDMGIFNLGSRTVEYFYPPEAFHPLISPPSWFFPSPRL